MPRRRLLLVSQHMGIGGLERVIATIARTLDPELFSPRVVCLRYKGDFGEALEDEGVPVEVLPRQEGKADYFAFRHLADVIRRESIDVIHTHNTDAFITGGLGRILARRRTVHVHTDHARSFPDRFRYYVAEHVLARLAYRVVGVSDHTTDNLARYEWIPRRKLVTIPNGIDPSPFDAPAPRAELRARLGVPPDAPLMGLGARITDQKGVDVLLHAMPRVLEAVPDARLAVVGEGPDRPDLERLSASLGLTDSVHFLGARTDFVELVPALDIYALPSRWEGLPMVILEAMAARLAIVATDVGGVANAVRHESTGLLVPSEDPVRLADELIRALRDPELRRRLGGEARRVFDEEYSAEVMTRRYEALYLRRGLPDSASPARA